VSPATRYLNVKGPGIEISLLFEPRLEILRFMLPMLSRWVLPKTEFGSNWDYFLWSRSLIWVICKALGISRF